MVQFTYEFFFDISTSMLTLLYSLVYIHVYDVLYVSLFLINFWNIIINKTFRAKFIYFFALLALTASWGFYHSFDGIILLFLVAEFLIILLFLLLYLTITFELSSNIKTNGLFFLFSLIGITIYFLEVSTNSSMFFINYVSTYQQMFDIISADFFIFFYFFFLIFPEITILLGLLLGLFSIFFIFFYFTLKFKQQQTNFKKLNYMFIRKQQLIHQSNYNVVLTNFQQ